MSMNPLKTQTKFLYTLALLKDGWMFLQHLAHVDTVGPALGRQSVLQVYPPPPHVLTIRHQLAAIALILPSKTWEYVVKSAVYCWIVLFTWQYTTWKYNYFTLIRCF